MIFQRSTCSLKMAQFRDHSVLKPYRYVQFTRHCCTILNLLCRYKVRQMLDSNDYANYSVFTMESQYVLGVKCYDLEINQKVFNASFTCKAGGVENQISRQKIEDFFFICFMVLFCCYFISNLKQRHVLTKKME